MRKAILVLMAFALFAPPARSAEVAAKGEVKTVVLYRGQALVTRAVPVDAPAGAVQLTVTDLPEAIQAESLFASGGSDLQIRAVRFRTQALGEAPQAEVRELDARIKDAEKKLRANEQMQRLSRQQGAYLDALQGFVAPTVQVEMAKGVLNADTLAKVTDVVFTRRGELAKELLKLAEEQREVTEELELLQRKRGELTGSYSRTTREAVVYLDKAGAGAASLRLSYLVGNATWSPTYNVRGNIGGEKVAVEFGALVRQSSGEDWTGVDLTLSTAGALLSADGPGLTPLRVTVGPPPAAPPQANKVAALAERVGEVQKKLRQYQDRQANVYDGASQVAVQFDMNRAADEAQNLELAASNDDVTIIRRTVREEPSVLSANYALEGKISIASRYEGQTVQIRALELPAAFHYEAVPLLSEYVYRYAQIQNNSDIALLDGQANVYLGGEFVGKASMPVVACGQRVTLGFGADSQLRARREFVSKEEGGGGIMRSTKDITYRYRLVLENYSNKDVSVWLFDRIPVQTDKIAVALDEGRKTLSKDAVYLRTLREKGILRWDTAVPAGAARDKAALLEYTFTLTFDKNLAISEDVAERAQPAAAAAEALDMLRGRFAAE